MFWWMFVAPVALGEEDGEETPAESGEEAVESSETAPPAPPIEDAIEAPAPTPAPPPAPAPAPAPNPLRKRGSQMLMVAYGGAYGGYLGGTVAGVVGDEDTIAAGVLLGGVLGGATTFALASREVTNDQAIFLGSASTLGAWAGIETARAVIPPGDEAEFDRIALAGALGSLATTGLGIALLPHAPSAERMLHTDVGALVGWQMAAAASDVLEYDSYDDRQKRAPLALAGGLFVGAVAMRLNAMGVEPSGELMALSLAHGTWIGAWAPMLGSDSPDEQQQWGGLRLGLGAGYATALVLAPFVDPGPRSVALQSVGIVAGSALGAGIPLSVGLDREYGNRAVVGPMLAAGIAGQAMGALVSPFYSASRDDLALVSAMGLWTGYQAVGWGFYAGHMGVVPSQASGYALTVAGAGTLATLSLVPLVDVTPAEATMMTTGGGWGTWYGGWGGHLLGMSPNDHWLLTLSAGNAALLGTAGIVGFAADPSWQDVAIVNGLGLLGGATGSLVGIVASPDLDAAATGGLIGSTLGLGAGIAIAARPGEPFDLALEDVHLGRLAYTPSFEVMPWADDEGRPGAWVEVGLREKAR